MLPVGLHDPATRHPDSGTKIAPKSERKLKRSPTPASVSVAAPGHVSGVPESGHLRIRPSLPISSSLRIRGSSAALSPQFATHHPLAVPLFEHPESEPHIEPCGRIVPLHGERNAGKPPPAQFVQHRLQKSRSNAAPAIRRKKRHGQFRDPFPDPSKPVQAAAPRRTGHLSADLGNQATIPVTRSECFDITPKSRQTDHLPRQESGRIGLPDRFVEEILQQREFRHTDRSDRRSVHRSGAFSTFRILSDSGMNQRYKFSGSFAVLPSVKKRCPPSWRASPIYSSECDNRRSVPRSTIHLFTEAAVSDSLSTARSSIRQAATSEHLPATRSSIRRGSDDRTPSGCPSISPRGIRPSSRRKPTSHRWHPKYILRRRPRGSGCHPCEALSHSRRGTSGSWLRSYCRYDRY